MIVNLCFLGYAATNIGEHYTQPVDYFDFNEEVRKISLDADVGTYLDPALSLVIIGGGGIAGAKVWSHLRRTVDTLPPTIPIVVWGMGINEHGRLDRQYDETLLELEQRHNVFVGLRDCFYKSYVPCVSCMRPELDESVSLEHEVVFYAHHLFPNLSLPCPTMTNKIEGDPASYFNRVICFLGSSEVVVTNTYHGAYWATLLKKMVVVVAPFSNKFMGFKHEPMIVQDIRELEPIMKDRRRLDNAKRLLKSYPTAIVESRELNQQFHKEMTTFRKYFGRREG